MCCNNIFVGAFLVPLIERDKKKVAVFLEQQILHANLTRVFLFCFEIWNEIHRTFWYKMYIPAEAPSEGYKNNIPLVF